MKLKLTLILFSIFLLNSTINAQEVILNEYIREGIQKNQTLKQQGFQLQKALFALDEAKTLYSPTVNLNTTYSTAAGGRSISFPLGDIVNPIYSTLNQLTKSQSFPAGSIPNVNEQLVPKNYYDVRFKTTMPLVNAEIKYNKAIKQEMIGLQKTEIQVYKRELVKDIKTAYFNYLKASEAVKIYDNALKLLHESERVNQSLINNGSANPTVLVRTKNEITKIESEKLAAQATQQNAQAYFNYLTTRDFSENIEIDSTYSSNINWLPTLEQKNREELEKLQRGINLNRQIQGLNTAYKVPKIGIGLDLGSQGSITDIKSENLFVLLGLSMDFPVYSANRNKLKIKQTEMELAALDTQLENVKRQLELQTQTTQNSYNASLNIYQSKQSQIESAQRYYRDIFRRYKEGQANFIELLDAQTQITTAELQKNLAHYDVWLKLVELERAKASFQL